MESTYSQNKIYYGNFLWYLEAFKVSNKEINYDKPIRGSRKDQILFYECVVFNEDKEDALYCESEEKIFEYTSHDKCELVLKLLKLYQNRYDLCPKGSDKSLLPQIKLSRSKFSNSNNFGIISKSLFNKTGSMCSINALIYGNLLLVYKDGTSKWVYDYELKKLLFYLKLLPNYKNLKVLRIFAPHIKNLKINSQTYVDKEDEFSEIKEENSKNAGLKTKEEVFFEIFTNNLKSIFSEKYGLILRGLDIRTFELVEGIYLLDIQNIKLEQFSNKFSQLASERKLTNFKERFQYKNLKLKGEAPNLKEIKSFFFSMYGVYENVRDVMLKEYLYLPENDLTTDNAFHDIRSDCPYRFSELISDSVTKKKFQKWASTSLWNN